jgi:hypothetical protein
MDWVNKFNLGPNPVATIDALLRKRLNGVLKTEAAAI